LWIKKKNYRILDFRNAFYNIIGILIEIHYDPNRSAYIGLVNFVKIGLLSYVLLPDGLREGGKIFFYDGVSFIGDFIKVGFSCALKYMPLGVFLHNVEFKPGNGGGLARAAGTCVKVLRKSSLKKKKKLILWV